MVTKASVTLESNLPISGAVDDAINQKFQPQVQNQEKTVHVSEDLLESIRGGITGNSKMTEKTKPLSLGDWHRATA